MPYLVRFYGYDPVCRQPTVQLSGDRWQAELSQFQVGQEVVIDGVSYRVAGLPRLKLIDHPQQPGRKVMLIKGWLEEE